MNTFGMRLRAKAFGYRPLGDLGYVRLSPNKDNWRVEVVPLNQAVSTAKAQWIAWWEDLEVSEQLYQAIVLTIGKPTAAPVTLKFDDMLRPVK